MMESQAGERASLDMMTESEPRRLPVRDSLSDLLGPDVILPQQFFDGPRGDSDFSPEKALMLAILEAGRTGLPVATDWGYRRSADPAAAVPDGHGVA